MTGEPKRERTTATNRGRPKGLGGVLPEGTLGPLETEVMEVVWLSDQAVTTRDVHERLQRRRPVAYTTVMTVMGNLTRKGLLERRPEGRAYLYRALVTQQRFTHSHVAEVVDDLLDRFTQPTMSTLINKLDSMDEQTLAELEAKVRRLRRQRGQGDSAMQH